MIKTLYKQAELNMGNQMKKPSLGQPASHRKGDVVDWLAGVITQQKTAGFIYFSADRF